MAMTTDATDAGTRMIAAGIGILQEKRDETCLGGLRNSTADSGVRGGHDSWDMISSECGLGSAGFVLHGNSIVAVEAQAEQAG